LFSFSSGFGSSRLEGLSSDWDEACSLRGNVIANKLLELTKIFFFRGTFVSSGAEAEEIYTSGIMKVGWNVRSCEAEIVRAFIPEAL
jgi:hypothetical protein